MKFTIHRTKSGLKIPSSAIAVAGFGKQRELRLEVGDGVVIILREKMNAKQLLTAMEFLQETASNMLVAVALESGSCSGCGSCLGDDWDADMAEECECDACPGRETCRGVEIPMCLLDKAGIGSDQGLDLDAIPGTVTIRALKDDDMDDMLPDDVPEVARLAFRGADICVSCLRELLENGNPIDY